MTPSTRKICDMKAGRKRTNSPYGCRTVDNEDICVFSCRVPKLVRQHGHSNNTSNTNTAISTRETEHNSNKLAVARLILRQVQQDAEVQRHR